jgi:hypothetical protein
MFSIRDSPDDSQTSMNIRAFPAFLQDRRGVQTTSSASGGGRARGRSAGRISLGKSREISQVPRAIASRSGPSGSAMPQRPQPLGVVHVLVTGETTNTRAQRDLRSLHSPSRSNDGESWPFQFDQPVDQEPEHLPLVGMGVVLIRRVRFRPCRVWAGALGTHPVPSSARYKGGVLPLPLREAF